MNSKEETIIERAIKLGEQKVLTQILHGNKEEIYNLIEDFQEKYYDIEHQKKFFTLASYYLTYFGQFILQFGMFYNLDFPRKLASREWNKLQYE